MQTELIYTQDPYSKLKNGKICYSSLLILARNTILHIITIASNKMALKTAFKANNDLSNRSDRHLNQINFICRHNKNQQSYSRKYSTNKLSIKLCLPTINITTKGQTLEDSQKPMN
ncbi:hypothetical protein [Saccharicrinis aurantiacus]|uniref:hypothetical protein n=1 Tax=Saccharicrinis aurantiacus TaxID=1849719 RepID=UPI00094FEDF7|nr:hypothetical protein [Saccharicrinis aurantiacus]